MWSEIDLIRYLQFLHAGWLLCTLAACSTAPCPQSFPQPSLQVGHISGGVAPTVNSLEVYENGTVRLSHVGGKSFCSHLPEEEVQQLLELAMSSDIGSVEWTADRIADAERAHIQMADEETRVLLDPPPAALYTLLLRIDQVFRKHFGSKYYMSLVEEEKSHQSLP